jgi:uncharacterized protein
MSSSSRMTRRVLESAIARAKLGHAEEMAVLKGLDDQALLLERIASGPSFETFVAKERACSASLDGRSVIGREREIATGRRPAG